MIRSIDRLAYLRGVLKLSDLESFVAMEIPELRDEEIASVVRTILSDESLDWTQKLSECRRAIIVVLNTQCDPDQLLLLSKGIRAAKKGDYKTAASELRTTDWTPDAHQKFRFSTQMTNDIWSWRWV